MGLILLAILNLFSSKNISLLTIPFKAFSISFLSTFPCSGEAEYKAPSPIQTPPPH